MTTDRRSRMPMIAFGCAVLAVAVSLVAAFVVVTRDDDTAAARAPAVAALSDQRVSAADVIALKDQLEVVIEAGLPRGVRVKDAVLAKALGLQEDDVITSLSGRPVTSESDVSDVTFRAGSLRATVIYVELDRGTARTLVRWQLDGSLVDARRDALAAHRARMAGSIGSLGTGSGSPFGAPYPLTPSLKNPFDDPVLDTIEKIDDTHFRMPRSTFEALLADSAVLPRSARVIPSMKNGQRNGYKVFAIGPGSVFQRLGVLNGDAIHSVNGEDLAEIDDLVSWFVNARRAPEFRFELTRRGQPVTLDVTITR